MYFPIGTMRAVPPPLHKMTMAPLTGCPPYCTLAKKIERWATEKFYSWPSLWFRLMGGLKVEEGGCAPPVTNLPPARSHLLILVLSVAYIRSHEEKKLFEVDLNLDLCFREAEKLSPKQRTPPGCTHSPHGFRTFRKINCFSPQIFTVFVNKLSASKEWSNMPYEH